MPDPKILVYDIETAPIIADVWKLWKNDIGLNQIKKDWEILAWGAKWYDPSDSTVMYRGRENNQSEKSILKPIWALLNEADIVVTQNGKNFDEKRLNAKFIEYGFKPTSSYKHIDVMELASKRFGFTSNRLEYLTNKLCKKYKKLKHSKYPGHDLWTECLKGNKDAWKEMEKYNKYDVLSLEELFTIIRPWGTRGVNFGVYTGTSDKCFCGSVIFHKNGYTYSSVGKYQRYSCAKCGAELRDRRNLLTRVNNPNLKVGA